MQDVNFILTKVCNAKCSYCNVWNSGDTIAKPVDINLINSILDTLPNYFGRVNAILNGGEVGLVPNIQDVVFSLAMHDRVKRISIYSNGTIRHRGLLPSTINYKPIQIYEHAFVDLIGEDTIQYFSYKIINFDLLNPRARKENVTPIVVVTPNFLKFSSDSFIEKLSKSGVQYKMFAPKVRSDEEIDIKQYYNFFKHASDMRYDLAGDKDPIYLAYKNTLHNLKAGRCSVFCKTLLHNLYYDLSSDVPYIGQCTMDLSLWDNKMVFNVPDHHSLLEKLRLAPNKFCKYCFSGIPTQDNVISKWIGMEKNS
jgi:hypothetical protein